MLLEEPNLPRSFKIPGGWLILILLTILPMGFALIVLAATLFDSEAGWWQIYLVLFAMMSGVGLYFIRRPQNRKQENRI